MLYLRHTRHASPSVAARFRKIAAGSIENSWQSMSCNVRRELVIAHFEHGITERMRPSSDWRRIGEDFACATGYHEEVFSPPYFRRPPRAARLWRFPLRRKQYPPTSRLTVSCEKKMSAIRASRREISAAQAAATSFSQAPVRWWRARWTRTDGACCSRQRAPDLFHFRGLPITVSPRKPPQFRQRASRACGKAGLANMNSMARFCVLAFWTVALVAL